MKTNALLLLLTLSIIISGCRKPAPPVDPEAFAEYVAGYTTGVIPKKDPVRIRLNTAVTAYEPGKELPATLFSFVPAVKGKAYLVAPDLVEFRPDGAWPSGEEITVSFNLGELIDIPEKLRHFSFSFYTITPSFIVDPGIMVSFGEMENKMTRVEGSLSSADFMEMEEVEKLVTTSSVKGNFKTRWEPGNLPNRFNFIIDSIPRLEEAYTLTITWNGNPLGITLEGSHDYEIPSVNDFIFMGYQIRQGEEQSVEIIFSDIIDPAQDLNGLVYFPEGDEARLIADRNIIRLYPATRISGPRTLIVEGSVRNDLQKALGKRIEQPLIFEELRPAAEFLLQGVIMPDPKGLTLPIRTVSLRAVDVVVYKMFENNIPYYLQENSFTNRYYNFKPYGRPVYAKTLLLDDDKSIDLHRWNTFSLDLSPLMNQDPGAVYRVKLLFRKAYSVHDCGTAEKEDLSEYILDGKYPDEKLASWDLPGWDNEDDWPEDYSWSERDNPCSNSYYVNDRFSEKLVLSSQIGVTAKSSDGKSFRVIATNLMNAEPWPGIKIEFYNFQNQMMGSVTTGSGGEGEVRFDGQPYYLKAIKEKQRTWMRLDDGSALPFSHFDIGGAIVQKGLKGMIYGERGVWRPGDTLFLTFILDDRANPLPEKHPVKFELFNSRGQMAYSATQTKGPGGFYGFRVPTDPDAPTGIWRAYVKVGGATFDKAIRVETVKPNRLKIKLDFNQEILNTFAGKPEGTLDVKWLHGAVSPGIRTSVNVSFRKSGTAFPGFEKYTFDNPATYFWADERNIFDKELDNKGQAKFTFELPTGSNAPGMLDATFLVRAFEKGGDFSTDVFTRQFSPFRQYVGIHVPDGGSYQDMLETDTDHRVEIATVDWQGKPLSAKDLEVRVYRIEWRWWWSSGEEDLAYYIGNQDAQVIYQGLVSTTDGRGSFNLRINYPNWGRYLILVKDPAEGHQAGLPVYFDWPSYVNRSGRANPAGATMLTFSADKEKYHPGDKAVISFPAAEGSRALVSVESGSHVLSSHWKMCKQAEETVTIDITKGMAPNVYVYLSLVQPHDRTANDRPIRMYGVIPLMIEDPETLLQPVISMPETLEPEEEFVVKVSEKNGKPMTFTVAVVDEGLLDLTRFKTPAPHDVFYAREALGVRTWDMYDLVIGAYGGRLQKVLAIGGDEGALMSKDKKAQRFVPVVRFAGPFTLEKGGRKEIRFRMPNYVGSVRTMVIAGHDGAYGHADRTTPVRKDLMVLATLPRVLGPGEEVELPVSVFAMGEQVKDARVEVSSNDFVTVTAPSASISFDQPGEQMVYFNLKVNEKAGIGKIKVIASSGSESASQEIEIEVRNPNPVMTQTFDFVIEPGQSASLPYAFFGMAGTNKGVVTYSGMPDFDLGKHLEYLVRYPYGCLEQTVSSVFPQLFIASLMELPASKKGEIDGNIRAAISKISKMFLSDGSLTYWPGQTMYSDWGTSYAGHFLLLAENKGYLLPAGLKDKWIGFQQRTASAYRQNAGNEHHYFDVSQAYRLYTLALAQKPLLSAMNRMRESGNYSPSAAWILASAYLYAGKPEAAEEIISGHEAGITNAYELDGHTFGSSQRDLAFTLETLLMLRKDTEAFRLMQKMAAELKNNYFSTQTTAFSLWALANYIGDKSSGGINFEYAVNQSGKATVNTAKSIYSEDLGESAGLNGNIDVKNLNTGGKLFVTITLSGQPLHGTETELSSNLRIAVAYEDEKGGAVNVAELKQGTDFIAKVTVEHAGLPYSYSNLALNQVFPSGWEIINTRVQDMASGLQEDAFEYRDIRDDRVYTFFELQPNQKKTFRIRLNASYTGRYYLPSVVCEAMYENNIQAHTKGRWVSVVR